MRFYVVVVTDALSLLKNVMRNKRSIFYGTLINGNGWV